GAFEIHNKEGEHFICLEGTLDIANGDHRSDVPAGTSVTVKRGVPHAWCNPSDTPLHMLVVFSPDTSPDCSERRRVSMTSIGSRPLQAGTARSLSGHPCSTPPVRSTRLGNNSSLRDEHHATRHCAAPRGRLPLRGTSRDNKASTSNTAREKASWKCI